MESNLRKQLGKISRCTFGYCGYQDVMIGLNLSFDFNGSACATFYGTWAHARSPDAKWTEQDRINHFGETVIKINELLKKSKVNHIAELVGIPVEVTFEGNAFKDFRILEEVL